MSLVSIKLVPETIKTIGFIAISASFTAIGSPSAHPASQFIINNATDAPMLFSFDGTSAHLFLEAHTSFVSNVTSNKSIGQGLFLPVGTTVYVKQVTAPGAGAVYVSIFYAQS